MGQNTLSSRRKTPACLSLTSHAEAQCERGHEDEALELVTACLNVPLAELEREARARGRDQRAAHEEAATVAARRDCTLSRSQVHVGLAHKHHQGVPVADVVVREQVALEVRQQPLQVAARGANVLGVAVAVQQQQVRQRPQVTMRLGLGALGPARHRVVQVNAQFNEVVDWEGGRVDLQRLRVQQDCSNAQAAGGAHIGRLVLGVPL